MAVVETRSLTKIFKEGELGAVNDVNLVTQEGEFLVFLGPSGSGKTTISRLLFRLHDPAQGFVRLTALVAAFASLLAATVFALVTSEKRRRR